MTHICVRKLTIIGSDNGLSPGRRQAIIWTNAGILLIGTLGTNFIEILIEILIFSFKKMHLIVSSAKRRPFCPGLNVLRLGTCRLHLHMPNLQMSCRYFDYLTRYQDSSPSNGHQGGMPNDKTTATVVTFGKVKGQVKNYRISPICSHLGYHCFFNE